jgi:ketosteroid isomerase-like protein
MTLVLLALLLQQPDAATVAELTRLEHVWNDAQRQSDAAALDKLFADDIVITVPEMPRLGKSSTNLLRTGRMKFDTYESSDVEVHVNGDSAVVTGRIRRARINDGKTFADDWLFTKTYVRRGGDWKVVAFHASNTPKP